MSENKALHLGFEKIKVKGSENLERNKNKVNLKKQRMQHKNKKRSLFNYRFKLLFKSFTFFALIAIVGAAISLGIFFKIEKIEVLGDTRYTSEEIINSSKVKTGQNLVLLNKEKTKEKMEKELPFLKVKDIKKTVPNKLTLEVEEIKKYGYIESDGVNILFDQDKKVIEIKENVEENILKIKGVEILDPKIGEKIKIKSKNKEETLYKILDLLEEYDLTEPTEIDLSNESKVTVGYQNRINILVGNLNELDYKIKTAAEIINNRLDREESGELDLSLLDQGDTSYFRMKKNIIERMAIYNLSTEGN